MKCAICILRGTDKKNIYGSDQVQEAVDDAREAVTFHGGIAYCVEHFYAEVVLILRKF